MAAGSMFDNLVIRASAGSGKTFRLTNRYLGLLLEGVPVETIKASTFTRKAAGEILDRVLTRLAKAALSDESARTLSDALFGDGGRVSRSAILDLLASLVRKFHALNISTLDSFIMKTAGSFTPELGLPAGWRIVEESEDNRNLNAAVRLALSGAHDSIQIPLEFSPCAATKTPVSRRQTGEDMEKMKCRQYKMLALLDLLFKGETVRTLSKQLYDLVRELLGVYSETDTRCWEPLPRRKPLADAELAARIERLKSAPLPMTKTGKPNATAVKAFEKMVRAAGEENWSECCQTGLAKAVLYGTQTFSRTPLEPEMVEAIEGVLEQARAVELNRLIDQTKATREMLRRVIETFEAIKATSGAYRFDDLTFRLAHAESRSAEQSDYRTDNAIRHLLLDEFQDTSLSQWEILRPLAESLCRDRADSPRPLPAVHPADTSSFPPHSPFDFEKNEGGPHNRKTPVESVYVQNPDQSVTLVQPVSLREEQKEARSFFCVGDIKQAIYGWRGGTAEIFDEIEQKLHVRTESLVCNWRSAPAVIETVNRVFSHLDLSTPFEFAPIPEDNSPSQRRYSAARRACDVWLDGFEKHLPAEPNRTLLGCCAMFEAPKFLPVTPPETSSAPNVNPSDDAGDFDDSDDTTADVDLTVPSNQKETTIRFAVDRIEQIYRAIPGETIGVLLRGNKWIEGIVAELGRRGISASQEGGVPLTASPAVRALLSLLALADHPGDSIARFHLRSIPSLAEYFGVSDDDSPAVWRDFSLRIRSEITTDSFAPFVRRVIGLLAPLGNERDRKMLAEASKLAIRHESESLRRTDRFREIVEGAKTELADASRLRVMTIHKSKGLEFDTVVLPELDTALIGKGASCIVGRESPTAPIQSVLRRLPSELQPLLPGPVRDEYDRQTFAQTLESLNLLYVALTRAAKRLVLIVPPEGAKSTSKTASRLLRSILVDSDEPAETPFAVDSHEPEDFSAKGEPSEGRILFRLGDEESLAAVLGTTTLPSAPTPEEASRDDSERPSFGALAITRRAEPRFAPSHKPLSRRWADERRFERGTAIHRALALVSWSEETLPAREEVVADLVSAGISQEKALLYADEFFEIVRRPGAKHALSRSSYAANGTLSIQIPDRARPVLYRERLFLSTREKTGVDRGIVDRLVLLKEEDRVVAADVIDYKTDAVDDPNRFASGNFDPHDPLVTEYFGQLNAYRTMLMKRFELPERAVSIRLFLLSIDTVIDLSRVEKTRSVEISE